MTSFRPSVIDTVQFYYPLGNTPATCLVQELPPEEPAILLLLGCGDARNILFTCYADTNGKPFAPLKVCSSLTGLEKRPLDFTCCDFQTAVLVDEDFNDNRLKIWKLYFSLYLSEDEISTLHKQAQKLCELSKSSSAWANGRYGHIIRFCDEETLCNVHDIWKSYCLLEMTKNERQSLANRLEDHIERVRTFNRQKYGPTGRNITALRSAAPLWIKALGDTEFLGSHFWNRPKKVSQVRHPNPTLIPPKGSKFVLHYGTGSLLGFHLATAYADLTPYSPLLPTSIETDVHNVIDAARTQFFAWAASFQSRVCNESIVIRIFSGDALSFAYAVQEFANPSMHTGMEFYRDSYRMRPVRLDQHQSGCGVDTPTSFNVIDTSNLADHVGMVNLLVAAAPLLKPKAHSSLYTETLLKLEKDTPQMTANLLLGDFALISTLLKLFPVDYWTNSTTSAPEEELAQSISRMASQEKNSPKESPKDGQFHCRLLWKTNLSTLNKPGAGPFHLRVNELAEALYNIYLNMFENENHAKTFSRLKLGDPSTLSELSRCYYHRGSLVALLALLKNSISADWDAVFRNFLLLIENDHNLMIGTNYVQELYVYLHCLGLYTVDLIKDPELGLDLVPKTSPLFSSWNDKPGVLRVTLIVPRHKLSVFTEKVDEYVPLATPNLQCSLEGYSSHGDPSFQNLFAAVNLSFGTLKSHGTPYTPNFYITVNEDQTGWRGNSPLIVSFWAPTATLLQDPNFGTVSFGLQNTPAALGLYMSKLGFELHIHKTSLKDNEHVFITKNAPHLVGRRNALDNVSSPRTEITAKNGYDTFVSANLDQFRHLISLGGRIKIHEGSVLAALRDKAKVSVVARDSFTIGVIVEDSAGNSDFVIKYPVPVDQSKSKLRIARTSGYIEVIVPIASPLSSSSKDLVVIKGVEENVPVLWGMPRLKLDHLPALEISQKSELKWLITHTSTMWSSRERKIREAHLSQGFCPDPKLNFKESLFTLFMTYTDAQGGKSNVFGLNHKSYGGTDTLVFPQALRLDVANHTVVLDAVVFPLKSKLPQNVLHPFMDTISKHWGEGIRQILVDDDELEIWKHMLAVYVERCRTWQHGASCEYRSSGSFPLSTKYSEVPICSCGMGKINNASIRNLPGFSKISKYCSRAAISPCYGMPFVEKLYDDTLMNEFAARSSKSANACAYCNKEEDKAKTEFSKCGRCRLTKYCSKDCQKADWKEHKLACKPSAEPSSK